MEICTIGGFEEVGKNMTAVKVGEDVIIFDMGFFLPGIIELQDEPDKKYTEKSLRKFGAVPDDRVLDKIGWRDKVRAIVIGHAHLDHVGGVPYLAYRYPKAQILATPFTIKVLETISQDEGIKISNKMKIIQPNSTHIIYGKAPIKIEFIHATHSTIDCVFPVLHTKEGAFIYALDLKFDNHPTLGNPPNYKRLRELGNQGVRVLIVDALYSGTEKKPGGEKIAQHLLQDAFSKVNRKKSALFITTFSSHIERLNNIVNFGLQTKRQIVFIGRSLNKYVNCAREVGKCPFYRKIKLIKYKNQVNSFLKQVEKDRERYLVVCTGHQAEEGSILDRISKGETPFSFRQGDNLIFSSSVIPAPVNILAREKMDRRLRRAGVKIQTDVHVHGHGSREDLREILEITKPQHVIPAHGALQQETPFIDLANEFGYKFGETSHLVSNGKVINL